MRKRAISPFKAISFFFLTIIFLVFSLVAVSADEVTKVLSFAEDGYSGSETFFAPTAQSDEEPNYMILNLSGKKWNYSGDIITQSRHASFGIQNFIAEMPTSDELISQYDSGNFTDEEQKEFSGHTTLFLDYINQIYDLTDYDCLRFGICIQGDAVHYPVIIQLETTDGIYEAKTYISANEASLKYSLITFDLSDISGKLLNLTVKTEYSRESLPYHVRCTLPYATTNRTAGFSNAERFSTARLSAETGTVTLTGGRVIPDNSGMAYLDAMLAVRSQPAHNSSAYFEIKLSNLTQGNLTISVLYAGTTNEQRRYSKKISLSAENGIYTVPIEVYDDIYSFSLQFDNVECNGSFIINSIKLYGSAKALLAGNSAIGTVSSIKRNGDSVTLDGTMERDFVKQASGESIYFYAIPGSSPDDQSTAIELGRVKVSTIFESTLDLSQYPSLGDTFMFYAAIKTKDKSGNEIILPLSHPRYADGSPISESKVSNVGLHNPATVGAFESNVSHVIVDISLDELITSDSTSIANTAYISYGSSDDGSALTKQLYFSMPLLDSLDRDIKFYISAGIEVYLKLLFSSEELLYNAPNDPDYIHRYAAVVRFLTRRYSGIAGIVLGDGVNSSDTVESADLSDISVYASVIADMCRVTYNASSTAIPDILVIIPFVPNDGASWISERTLTVMLSDRFADIGQIPWAFLYTLYDSETKPDIVNSTNKLLYDLEIEGAGATMFLCKPSNKTLMSEFSEANIALPDSESPEYNSFVASSFIELCELYKSYKARAVFFSLDGISVKNDHNFYSALKKAGQSDRFVYDSRANIASESNSSSYTLWDFTNKYHSLDWLAGGGVSSCYTVPSTRFIKDPTTEYGRVLRSTFESEDSTGVAGIILRNFQRKYDLSEVDSIDFTFSLEKLDGDNEYSPISFDNEDVTIVFVIGTDDRRAEYYADNIKYGEALHFSCDLTEYEYRSTVDYVGIMLYADYEVALDLSTVSASSMTLDKDELASLFSSVNAPESSNDFISFVLFISIIAMMTIFVVVLLNRRDREEVEQREAELKNAPKNRRNSRQGYNERSTNINTRKR